MWVWSPGLVLPRRHQVVCVDNDAEKVKTLQAGGIPIYEPGLEELVKRNTAAGRLSFTTSTAEGVDKSDVVFIAVPTPPLPDGSVDLSFIERVARDIAARHDQLQDRGGQEHRPGQDRRQGRRDDQTLLQGARRVRRGQQPGIPSGRLRGGGPHAARPDRHRRALAAARGCDEAKSTPPSTRRSSSRTSIPPN